ncbi:MAG: hypothetical protein KC414_07275, partial [Romboutsia sp.]|nr:hypothetical protein [Romboutsia sp.]
LNETYIDEAYGYLHQYNYFNTSSSNKKYERQHFGNDVFPSQDIYCVASQGLTGIIQPFVKNTYLLYDNETNKGIVTNTLDGPSGYTYATENVASFKFLGDLGANYNSNVNIADQSLFNTNYQQIFDNRIGSKQIEYIENNGHITGFKIIDTDGKIYEYLQPIFSKYMFAHSEDTELNAVSNTTFSTPFAVSWLLTAMKGPDYVDRGVEGISDDDWGYWVSFDYVKESKDIIWRAPFEGFAPGIASNDIKAYSIGFRESYTLAKIETNTYYAEFISAPSHNRYTPNNLTGLNLSAEEYIKNYGTTNSAIYFEGNWESYLDDVNSNTEVIEIFFIYQYGVNSIKILKSNLNYEFLENENRTLVTFDHLPKNVVY